MPDHRPPIADPGSPLADVRSPNPDQRSPILYCHCAYAQVVPPEVKTAVLEALSASGASFEAVPDLCEMAARRDPGLAQIASAGNGPAGTARTNGPAGTIVACYPRAVRWLFGAGGTPLPDGVRVLNMRAASAAEILADLGLPAGVDASGVNAS